MARYVYPAIFTKEENGLYSVDFPDIKGCVTCGDDLADALYMAQDVLAFTL
ncbi:MAG: type II toxin-antitoxin system HicB family antitoxin, partial [Oribacterium sp.]|nr:type II toxin-antitoxin system HicB family antitoxin [Oribacterium sp.]